jgi:hypothetical protein
MVYEKYKIVKVRKVNSCWYCSWKLGSKQKLIKKGSPAVAFANYPRCLSCGEQMLKRQQKKCQRELDQINNCLRELHGKYLTELITAKLVD